ncbi:hypothetical protein H7F33_08660 [Pedobacter sp. PAMC26386]|nr:hypothetical protein H7F33_08660 [Pedobacter sp. PAMC26386]
MSKVEGLENVMNSNHYKIFRGFYKPKKYTVAAKDKLNANDEYSFLANANKSVNLALKSSKNGESSTLSEKAEIIAKTAYYAQKHVNTNQKAFEHDF